MEHRNLDALLQLVADRRRRQVIQYLRHETGGETTIDDLVGRMTTDGRTPVDRTSGRQQLAIQLYHRHLPKLADHGVVDFDPEKRTVRYQSDDRFEAVLDSLPDGRSIAQP